MSYSDQYDVDILASQVLESLEMFRICLREVQRIQTITTLFWIADQEGENELCTLFCTGGSAREDNGVTGRNYRRSERNVIQFKSDLVGFEDTGH